MDFFNTALVLSNVLLIAQGAAAFCFLMSVIGFTLSRFEPDWYPDDDLGQMKICGAIVTAVVLIISISVFLWRDLS